MPPDEPMLALTDKRSQGYSASVGGSNLTEKETAELTERFARLAAERMVRNVFASRASKPLDRIGKRISKLRFMMFKAHRHGR